MHENVQCVRFALLIAVLLSLSAGQARAQKDEPLPRGARARLSESRHILRTGPQVGLVGPAFEDFLAPTLVGKTRRYKLATGVPLEEGNVGPGQVVVSLDGKRAAVARTGGVDLIDVANGKEIMKVVPPFGVAVPTVPGVSLSADGSVLAFGGQGRNKIGMVVVWDTKLDKLIASIQTERPAPVFPTLSHDGKTLITHGPPMPAATVKPAQAKAKQAKEKALPENEPDRIAQVWDLAGGGQELFQARLHGMGGEVVAAAFSRDDALIALSAGDGPVDVWETKTGQRLHTLLGRKGQGLRVAFSPDGKTVASVGANYRIQRWSTDTGKELALSDAPGALLVAQITGLTFADNERVIAWMTAAQFAVAWDSTGKVLSPTTDHIAAINSVSFANQKKEALSAGQDGRNYRWDTTNGNLKETIDFRSTRLPNRPLLKPVVVFSADSLRATCLTNPAEHYELLTGDELFVVPSPASPPAPVNFQLSPDGLKLVTVSRQPAVGKPGQCAVWDLPTRKCQAEFEIPETATTGAPAAVFCPDGSRVVIATAAVKNGKLYFVFSGYDAKTGEKVGAVENPVVSPTITFGVADQNMAVVRDVSGRVWAVDYVNGKVEEDMDRVPVQAGETPFSGPLVFSPDGKRFAFGVVGKAYNTYGVKVYDFATRRETHTLIGHLGPISALRFSDNGDLLASGSQDASVLIWDLN